MLLYFILGILFVSLGMPLLENIDAIISAFVEYIVYILAYKIVKLKKKIKEESPEQQKQEEFQIGFRDNEILEVQGEELPLQK